MSTTDKADELRALADAMGNVLIPGSQTITAKYVISPELLNRMAAAALAVSHPNPGAMRAEGEPLPSPEQKGFEQ